MKLNKQEIDAIIYKITSNEEELQKIENEKVDKIRKELYKDPIIIKKAKTNFDDYNLFPTYLQKAFEGWSSNRSFKWFLDMEVNNTKIYSKTIKKKDKNLLRSEIVLACVDSKDLKSLYKKLGIKE